MKILFVGDIYARPGKQIASIKIPKIINERDVDFCIVNGENAAGGFGITENIAKKFFSYGVDVITTGNHVWDRKDAEQLLDETDRIIRPANYPNGVPGIGYTVVSKGGVSVGVVNLLGRIFMQPVDCPFQVADKIVNRLYNETNIIIVDFHAETTSEKMALGYYLNGKVSAVLGTHTHVMTADEKILSEGTAFITDVGMTGPHRILISLTWIT